jgi:general stress protein 26
LLRGAHGQDIMENYEEVSDLTLADEDREALLKAQNECVFTWRTADGWPIGVVMSYVWRDEKVWLTASSQRPRIRAVRRDDRVSVVISSAGTRMPPATVTIKGHCAILEDVETKRWFYTALAAALVPRSEKQQAGFVQMLDSPRRVVMCVTPERFITFDGRKMGQLGVES